MADTVRSCRWCNNNERCSEELQVVQQQRAQESCRWWRQQFQAVNDQLEYLHESPLMQSNMETPSPMPGSEAHKNAQPPQQVVQRTPGDGGDGTYGYGAYPGQGCGQGCTVAVGQGAR